MGVHFKENEEKITMGMIISGIMIIAILVTSLIIYLLNINSAKNNGEIATKEELQTGEVKNNDDFESVSIDIGKSVNEAENEMKTNTQNNSNVSKNTSNNNTTGAATNISKANTSSNANSNTTSKEDTNKNTDKQENTENVKNNESTEIKFMAPVNGEILREFAKDSLVYSDTLEEWITHTGVDIKADKTTVVKAATKGKVEAIKNDPRYGLTVIISHNDGYKTVYANLLTAEYVVEGEDIEEGQTIGTVGNSSSFEIADDYHLHFELIKDGEYLNPCNFIDF